MATEEVQLLLPINALYTDCLPKAEVERRHAQLELVIHCFQIQWVQKYKLRNNRHCDEITYLLTVITHSHSQSLTVTHSHIISVQ